MLANERGRSLWKKWTEKLLVDKDQTKDGETHKEEKGWRLITIRSSGLEVDREGTSMKGRRSESY